MASFPGSKVHRKNRRKLGRGQFPDVPTATMTVTVLSADVAKVVSNVPIVFSSPLPLSVATLTFVSQVQVSTTEVDVTFSGALAGKAWTLLSNCGTTFIGGGTAAGSGTF